MDWLQIYNDEYAKVNRYKVSGFVKEFFAAVLILMGTFADLFFYCSAYNILRDFKFNDKD